MFEISKTKNKKISDRNTRWRDPNWQKSKSTIKRSCRRWPRSKWNCYKDDLKLRPSSTTSTRKPPEFMDVQAGSPKQPIETMAKRMLPSISAGIKLQIARAKRMNIDPSWKLCSLVKSLSILNY